MIAPFLALALAIADTPAASPTSAPQTASSAATDYSAMAASVLSELNSGQYQAIEDKSTPAMKAALPADKLSGFWTGLQQQVGKYQGVTSTHETDQAGYHVVVAVTKFESATLDTTVTFDSQGLLAGLNLKPHEDAPAVPTTVSPPAQSADAPAPSSATAPKPASEKSDYVAMATNILAEMNAGHFQAVCDASTQQMKDALPADKLSGFWSQIVQEEGKYEGVVSNHTGDQLGYHMVVASIKFEHGMVNATLSFDGKGLLAGLYFKPEEKAAPPVAVPSGISEKPITIGKGTKWALPGTLTTPSKGGPFPVVILVHGSGPNDRDETIYDNKPFRDIAWGLARNGIATIRYDKRTKVHGKEMLSMGNLTVYDETIDDAALAAKLAETEPNVNRREVFILGHSLGGYLMPRIAQRTSFAAGYIVMAGLTETLTDALSNQINARFAGLKDADSMAALKTVNEQIAAADSPTLSKKTPSADLPFGIPAPYWLDLRGYSPTAMAKPIKQPMLFLQGADDFQVLPTDLKVWKTALANKKNATYKLYPGLSHLFMAGQKTPDDYAKPAHVDPKVITDIASWIKTVDTK